MKVICIENKDIDKDTNIITAYDYKSYFVADTASGSLLCSNGDELWYDPDYFITLEQWRENQLNQLGI